MQIWLYIIICNLLLFNYIIMSILKLVQDDVLKLWDDIWRLSDWYHTFDELYKHRIHLFIALCKNLNRTNVKWLRARNTMIERKFDWRFIMQLDHPWAWQISYHLPERYWSICSKFANIEDKANKWDWHNSNDVLDRLLLI